MCFKLPFILGVTGLLALGLLAGDLVSVRAAGPSTGPDTSWAFTPPHKPPLPAVQNWAWPANPIDAFVLAKLESAGLAPSPRADKLALLRRVTFDLTGLPPTLAEQEAFLADDSAGAYERVVVRLLASPHYGERWAQHWLDLVRYAESDGFKADDLRPQAFRYRDYVIQSFNVDLPYDRFICQQLAGDELEPKNPQALIATGFNRLWPDEYNAANLEQRRQEILDDVTDVTGQVFLGLTIGCARCHDHKFDPLLQTDYYRLQAFFAPMQPRDDLPAVELDEVRQYRDQRAIWEATTAELRAARDSLIAGKRLQLRQYALEKFRPEIQQAFRTPPEQRTPYEEQIARLAEKQLQRAEQDAPLKLRPAEKQQYRELEQRLSARQPAEPRPLPVAMAVTDIGRQAPPIYRLAGGDWRKPREELTPGTPSCLPPVALDMRLDGARASTGRRAALARWLTCSDHPLTARVMVNRLWQHHFGRGIVGTPSDFGSQGDPPTHPALLDWLAVDFMAHGWSLKYLHRLMVTSATYCQTSRMDLRDPAQARAYALDRENHLLWHAARRRLEGEAVRDALLALSGELNRRMFGPSARPTLPERISTYAWKPDARPADQQRRSVYVLAKRNMRYPLFDAFDLPDQHNSCARRTQTTTAPQALLLLNSAFCLEQPQRWSEGFASCCGEDERAWVAQAYRSAWGRPATEDEIQLALKFLRTPGTTLADFCAALLNTNEFLYID
jgi:hypothetical protein